MARSADVLVYDIENYPNCFAITLKRLKDDTIIQSWVHEERGVGGTSLSEIVDLFDNEYRFFAGYNSFHFDDQVMVYILVNRKELLPLAEGDHVQRRDFTRKVNNFANRIINRDFDYKEERPYKYHKYFRSLDLMKINRLYKGLKQVAVNLKWPLILDLPIKPNTDVHYEDLEKLLEYNINDVLITERLFEESKGEIQLRADVGQLYKVDLMNEDRSGMANRLLESFYEKETGLPKYTFKKYRTLRDDINLKACISGRVSFNRPELQYFLKGLQNTTLDPTRDKFSTRVRIGSTDYDIALGGIHSARKPEIFETTDNHIIKDCDVASYYPWLILTMGVVPQHLGPRFLKLYQRIVDERMATKKESKKFDKDTPQYQRLNLKQEALKIVVNSAYGKYGDENYWLYDPLAMYRVTLTGQMFLLMLIERLEDAGIEVIYANTDGITARVPKELVATYYGICTRWQAYTQLILEYADYKKFVVRDVNNYIAEDVGGYVKMKGEFDTERWKDLVKSFQHPVISLALKRYFLEGIPVTETINEHKDPLDFCMSQNIGGKFEAWTEGLKGRKPAQKTNRYVVSRNGVALFKEDYVGTGPSRFRISQKRIVAQPVTLVNDYVEGMPVPIDKAWYCEVAQKEVLRFGDRTQGSLFD